MGERLSGLLQDLRQTLSGASGMADSNQQLAGTFLLRADDITRQIQQAAGQLADVDQHGQSIQHAAGHSSSLAGAVRAKKDSSIVVGCRLVKEGAAQGFFSAGSTGACLAAGTLVMGRIKGVARPALATVIPSPVRPVVMCDIGANADCKPEYLVQFGQMASIYAEKVIGIEHPRAALLNIGEEDTKGSQFAQEAHGLLRERLSNFAGNAEGSDILPANFDVIITDGFTGNVCLKTIEGTSKTLFKTLKSIMMSTPLTKLGALAIKGGLKQLMAQVSPDTYGGAPLLGVKGALLVGHGSSNALAVKNGVTLPRDMDVAHVKDQQTAQPGRTASSCAMG